MPKTVAAVDATARPIEISFQERIRSMSRGAVHVAYLYESTDHSTFRYRVSNVVDALNAGSKRVTAAWFLAHEWHQLERLLPLVDVLVVCRCRYSYILDALVTRAHARGIDVIYDVDDLVVDTDVVPLLAHTLGETDDSAWDFWFGYVGRLKAALQLCNRVLVTTPQLAANVSAVTGKVVDIVPNFLNQPQLEVSGPIYTGRAAVGFAFEGPVHIGYFSGTPSHARDVAIVTEALACVLDRMPNARVRTVGHIDIGHTLARHSDRLEHLPLQDPIALQRLIGSTHVNLIPLQQNVFTDCKSELKYFESAAVGTVSIASPSATYRDTITDSDNGLLAFSHQWEEKLMCLVSDLLGTREFYTHLATEAHRHALRLYSWDQLVPSIEGALLRDA